MDVPDRVIEGCKNGDPDAFAELVRQTHQVVFALAFRMAGNAEDAADITQETYIKLLRKIKQFRGEAKFSTWLYRVTTTVALSHLRKRSRRAGELQIEEEQWDALPAPARLEPAERAEQAELRERLDGALAALPAGYRTIIVMKDVYGYSLQEAAGQAGITEGAAKVRLFRARRRLRDMLPEYAGTAGAAEHEAGKRAGQKKGTGNGTGK